MLDRFRSHLGAIVATLAALALLLAPSAALGASAFAVTNDGKMITFDPTAPGTITGNVTITGLTADTIGSLRGIDLRPATGGLYGIAASDLGAGSTAFRFYSVNTTTGAATLVCS